MLTSHDEKTQGLGEERATVVPWGKSVQSGPNLIKNPVYNKGLGFSLQERDDLRLRGLLPSEVNTIAMQGKRILWSLARKDDDLEKYDFLMTILDRNVRLFYHVLIHNLKQLLPVIWTPTVGRACLQFGSGYFMTHPRSMWVTSKDIGQVVNIVNNWPEGDVKVVVLTDGEGVLGLGDLGAHSAPIPISKSILYTACAGISPSTVLPVVIDVGTNNESLLEDPGYLGIAEKRNTEQYDELIEELMIEITRRYGPSTMFDFENFGSNAQRLLDKFQDKYCCYNDDIQTTAAVVLGIIYGSMRISKLKLSEQIFLFFGAGAAGVGAATLLRKALEAEGLSTEDAKRKIYLVDSKGLVVKGRKNLPPSKKNFSQDMPAMRDLEQIVRTVKATCLVGVSSQPNAFTQGVCAGMAKNTDRPLIIPLSNPREKAECTAHDAFNWTNYKCLFASGSPSAAMEVGDQLITPTQGTNTYINGALALGVIASGAQRIPQELFLAAAKAIGGSASEEQLETGAVLPPVEDIRNLSIDVAVAVATKAFELGLGTVVEPKSVRDLVLYNHWHHHNYPYLTQGGAVAEKESEKTFSVTVFGGKNFQPVATHFRPSCHGKADPYCLLTTYDAYGRTLDIKRTDVKTATLEPDWQATFGKWEAVDEISKLRVEIWDYDWWKFNDDLIGVVELSADQMDGEKKDVALLTDSGDLKNSGEVLSISALLK